MTMAWPKGKSRKDYVKQAEEPKAKRGRQRGVANHHVVIDWNSASVRYMVSVMNKAIDLASASGKAPQMPLHGEAVTPLACAVWKHQLKLNRAIEREMAVAAPVGLALASMVDDQLVTTAPADRAEIKTELTEEHRPQVDPILDAVGCALVAMRRGGLTERQIGKAARILGYLVDGGAA